MIALLLAASITIVLLIQFIPGTIGQYPYGDEGEDNIISDWLGISYSLLCCSLLIIHIIIQVWIYKDANSQGRDGISWAIFYFFTGLIALVIYLYIRQPSSRGFKDNYPRASYQQRNQFIGLSHSGDNYSPPSPPPAILATTLRVPNNIDYTVFTKKELVEECKKRDIKASWWTSDIKQLIKLLEDHDEKIRSDVESPPKQERQISIVESVKKPVLGEKTCPKCKGEIPLYSSERPLKVTCPDCFTSFMLKDKTGGEVEKESPKAKVIKKVPVKEIAEFGTTICPKCKNKIPITSKERPLKVTCPGCSASYTLKEKGRN